MTRTSTYANFTGFPLHRPVRGMAQRCADKGLALMISLKNVAAILQIRSHSPSAWTASRMSVVPFLRPTVNTLRPKPV
jgi:hypothetical protein